MCSCMGSGTEKGVALSFAEQLIGTFMLPVGNAKLHL